LVKANGSFSILGELLRRLTTGSARPAEIERELSAQIERSLALFGTVSHLDSHHHVHVHPRLVPIVLRLALRFGISYVRAPYEGFRPLLYQRPKARDAARVLAISGLGLLFGLRARQAGLRTTPFFRGIALGTGFDTAGLVRELRHLPAGFTELMVHPGYADAEAARLTSFTRGRAGELAALTSGEARAALEEVGGRLSGRAGPL